MKLLISAVAAIALALTPVAASAHHWHHHSHRVYHHRVLHHYRTSGHRYVAQPRSGGDQPFDFIRPLVELPDHVLGGALSTFGQIVGHRPRGCPHAYCGCGTSLYFFGHIVDSLNLAANWLRFPHVAPQAGVAAVAPSRHHVLAVVRHVSGMNFLVHDSNSGHGLTRDHVRNLAGYTFVDPRRGQV